MANQLKCMPSDGEGYSRRNSLEGCFICAIVDNNLDRLKRIVYVDDAHIALLVHFAALPACVLVAPKVHVEHVVRDLEEHQFMAVMRVVRRLALALEASVPTERTDLLSLGSQQGDSHLHWYIAVLPPGAPCDLQQYHELTAENGVIQDTSEEAAALAAKIKRALES